MKYVAKIKDIKSRFVVVLITVTLLGALIYSCSSDFDVKIENLDIPEEYNEVGILHNEGLEYIFEEIKVEGIEYAKSPRLKNRPFMGNKDEFIRRATLAFANQHEKLRKHNNIFIHVLKDTPSLKSSGVEMASPSVQQLLNEITSVLSQEFKEKELSRLKARLDVINQKAATTLSETDAAVIYCTTSTGYHSYQYWINNHKKWYFALNYPEILDQYNNEELNKLQLKNGKIRTKGWWNDVWDTTENWWDSASNGIKNWWDDGGREVVIADAAGATVGALEGSVLAVSTAGIAWGAIPTGAVRQAVYFSAGATIVVWLSGN